MKQDESIKKRIKEALFDRMDNADMGVNAQVEKGYVIVTGIVDTLSEKDYIEKTIRSLSGVKGVENALTISMDGKIDDDDVSRIITDHLAVVRTAKDVGAVTQNGVVYLKGHVKTLEEKNAAEQLARSVMGVKEVINQVRVDKDPDVPHDDASLTNAVEIVFAASPRVDAHDIKTLCKNGIIYLEGVADSQQEKDAASFLAGTVPGVYKVVNHISIEH